MVTYRLIISLWLLENKQWGTYLKGGTITYPISFTI